MLLKTKIYELAQRYREQLQQQLIRRVEEMEQDDCSHFLIYRILGISTTEGQQIDIYQMELTKDEFKIVPTLISSGRK